MPRAAHRDCGVCWASLLNVIVMDNVRASHFSEIALPFATELLVERR